MNKLATIFLLMLAPVFFILFACNNNAPSEKTSSKEKEIETPDIKTPIATDTKLLATYTDATVYAGSTDYYFKDLNGEVVKFRVSNFEKDPHLSLPDNLLDPNVEEGPPGGNPALIGKTFQLTYDVKDKLIEVVYMDK